MSNSKIKMLQLATILGGGLIASEAGAQGLEDALRGNAGAHDARVPSVVPVVPNSSVDEAACKEVYAIAKDMVSSFANYSKRRALITALKTSQDNSSLDPIARAVAQYDVIHRNQSHLSFGVNDSTNRFARRFRSRVRPSLQDALRTGNRDLDRAKTQCVASGGPGYVVASPNSPGDRSFTVPSTDFVVTRGASAPNTTSRGSPSPTGSVSGSGATDDILAPLTTTSTGAETQVPSVPYEPSAAAVEIVLSVPLRGHDGTGKTFAGWGVGLGVNYCIGGQGSLSQEGTGWLSYCFGLAAQYANSLSLTEKVEGSEYRHTDTLPGGGSEDLNHHQNATDTGARYLQAHAQAFVHLWDNNLLGVAVGAQGGWEIFGRSQRDITDVTTTTVKDPQGNGDPVTDRATQSGPSTYDGGLHALGGVKLEAFRGAITPVLTIMGGATTNLAQTDYVVLTTLGANIDL